MNLALPALVALLFLLPGIVLRYAYRRGIFRRSPITLGRIRDEIGPGIVIALLLHTVALYALSYGFGWSVDLNTVLSFAAKTPATQVSTASQDGLRDLFLYLAIANAGAYGVGLLAHYVVRYFHIDLRYDAFRFENEWYYLFEGEERILASDPESRTLREIRRHLNDYSPDWLYASVVIDQGGVAYLYWGQLVDYFFDDAGELRKILLEKAHRRVISAESDHRGSPQHEARHLSVSERLYPIDGDYLMIRLDDTMNLNIDYAFIQETTLPTQDQKLRSSRGHAYWAGMPPS